jgi:hypothetical protein
VAEIDAVTRGAVVFSIDPEPSASVVFRTSIDSQAAVTGAVTYRNLRDNAITGGRIVYSSAAVARDLRYVVHELGHVLGLQHSTTATDMMYYAARSDSPVVFTDNERLSVMLLLQRSPGNRYPDDASGGAQAASLAIRTDVVVN